MTDFDKLHKDFLEEGFDTRFLLKAKLEGPGNMVIGTETEYLTESQIMPTNVNFSFKCPLTGVSFDKLAISSFGENKYEVETSYDVEKVSGLKFGFRGFGNNKSDTSSDIDVSYEHRHGRIASKFSLASCGADSACHTAGLKSVFVANGAAVGNRYNVQWLNGLLFGASLDLALPNCLTNKCNDDKPCCPIKDFGGAVSWTSVNSKCSTVIQTVNKCTGLEASVYGKINDKLAVVGKGDSALSYEVGAEYSCNASTQIKAKVNNAGAISSSVTQQFPKNFTIIGAAQTKCCNLSEIKFGVTAVIG
jgi:hypothetical protein